MKVRNITFLIFPLTLHSQTMEWKGNELTFGPLGISRFIAQSLPEEWKPSSLVGGLYFKNHRYFFCRREPDGNVFCHLYLNSAHGDLQRIDRDPDYGQGNLINFANDLQVSKKKRTSKVKLTLVDEVFYIEFSGHLARRFIERMLPEYERVETFSNKTYVTYEGRLIHCQHRLNYMEEVKCVLAVPLELRRGREKEEEGQKEWSPF